MPQGFDEFLIGALIATLALIAIITTTVGVVVRLSDRVARYIIDSWGDADTTLAACEALGFSVERRQEAWRLLL